MAFTLSRSGQNNGAGGDKDLFLKVFSGEVMATYTTKNIMMPLHRTRTISSGKSSSFNYTGKSGAFYHVPGTAFDSIVFKVSEKVINIDQFLLAPHAFYDLDQAMQHFDVRREVSRQMGIALASESDKRLMQVGLLGARATTIIDGGYGGTELTNANYDTDAATLAAGIFACAQTFDEKDVPSEDRYIILKPAQYYLLAQDTNQINKDWSGAGSYSKGKVLEIAGITILMSNQLPQTNIAAPITGENNTYHGDFSNTIGLAFQREGLGTVSLLDLKMEMSREHAQKADLVSACYSRGHGWLRPECLIELKTA